MCNGRSATKNSESHSCACSGHRDGEAGRTVDASTELILPAVTFPTQRVLKIAGEENLRQLTRRHHALLQSSPIAGLFTKDPWAFAKLAERVADFVVEACGGATAYSEQQGDTCMRTRHFAFTIDESAREIWLAALFQAMADVDFPIEVRDEYWTWLEAFSIRMVNRRTMKAQPVRIPFVMAQLRFGGRSGGGPQCGIGIRFCPH
jgi:hemoglobin